MTAPIDLHEAEGGGGMGKEIPDELLLSLLARDGLQRAMAGSGSPSANPPHASSANNPVNYDSSLLFILRQRQEGLPPSNQAPLPNRSPRGDDPNWYNEHGQDRPK